VITFNDLLSLDIIFFTTLADCHYENHFTDYFLSLKSLPTSFFVFVNYIDIPMLISTCRDSSRCRHNVDIGHVDDSPTANQKMPLKISPKIAYFKPSQLLFGR
jgi:hypothetical protein